MDRRKTLYCPRLYHRHQVQNAAETVGRHQDLRGNSRAPTGHCQREEPRRGTARKERHPERRRAEHDRVIAQRIVKAPRQLLPVDRPALQAPQAEVDERGQDQAHPHQHEGVAGSAQHRSALLGEVRQHEHADTDAENRGKSRRAHSIEQAEALL